MRRPRIIASSLAALAVVVVVLTIAVSGGSATKVKPTPLNAGSALSVEHTTLGNVLVDANGRTLYLFEGDKRNRSTLSHAGFAVWPAFTSVGKPQAENGVSAAHIAIIKSDGKRQVTYYGHPLYYYVGDKASGETHGQGLKEFGALWYALSAKGSSVTSAPSAPAPAATESPGYSY
jgi:predicted lipoprotein with Yx(FWY)xxD motif